MENRTDLPGLSSGQPLPPADPPGRLESWLSGHGRLLFLLLAAAFLITAWLLRFVQDDAFISFQYAKQLVDGHGLTWFGTSVEGYTNFLWVLWIALGLRLGIGPVGWSFLGGLLSFAALIYGTWGLARLVLRDRIPSLLALLLLGTNYTVLAYATGGLETMLQTALLCLATLLLYRLASEPDRHILRRCLGISVLLTSAVLTRLDSVVLGAASGLGALWLLWRRRSSWRAFAALTAPILVITGGWFLWKTAYYGSLLPNTFAAKVGTRWAEAATGLLYLGRFCHWYLLWPLLLAGVGGLLFRKAKPSARLLPLVAMILLWSGYIVFVGGDFMEFRLIVPMAPYLFILVSWSVHESCGRWSRRPVLVATAAMILAAGASIHHANQFRGTTEDYTLDSIDALASFYDRYPAGDWARIGKPLGEALAGTEAILAGHAVGAIPFYSALKTVDMWGLNDTHIARNGIRPPATYRRPGHRRHARLSYLHRQGVTFILGHPTLAGAGFVQDPQYAQPLADWARDAVPYNPDPPPEVTIVGFPVNENEVLLMWYLTPTAAVDRIIRQEGWPRQTLHFGGRPR